jgi:N-acetylneuraminic acid mutarotase
MVRHFATHSRWIIGALVILASAALMLTGHSGSAASAFGNSPNPAISYTAPALPLDAPAQGTPTPSATPACGIPPAWQLVTPTRTPVGFLAGTTASDGNFYAAGGEYLTNGVPTNDMGRYNAATNTWTSLAPMPVAVFGHSMGAPATGKVYAVGGVVSCSAPNCTVTNTLQIYDIASNTWTLGPSVPITPGIEAAAAATFNGKLYLFGGDDWNTTYTTTYIYDPGTSMWSTGAPLPAPRCCGAATASGGLIYVYGGSDDVGIYVDTLFAYNPISNTWMTLSPSGAARQGNGLSPYGAGQILATGGSIHASGITTSTTTTYIYKTATDTWVNGPSLNVSRTGHAQDTLPDGRVIVFGGGHFEGSNTTTGTTELLDPIPPCATPSATVTPTPPATAPATASPTSCAITFNDVPAGSTFYDYIRCLACRGIVGGYPCGGPNEPCPGQYYRPNNDVTRGQVSKIVSESAGFSDAVPSTQQTFEDVPNSGTFWLWVERLSSRGIIGGYACGGPFEPCVSPDNRPYFRPNNNVTRGQLSKITSGAAGWTETPVGQTFEDVPPGSTFYRYIERMAARGIITGYPCGGAFEPCVTPGNRPYFRPNNNATRGQMSKIAAAAFFPGCATPAYGARR